MAQVNSNTGMNGKKFCTVADPPIIKLIILARDKNKVSLLNCYHWNKIIINHEGENQTKLR